MGPAGGQLSCFIAYLLRLHPRKELAAWVWRSWAWGKQALAVQDALGAKPRSRKAASTAAGSTACAHTCGRHFHHADVCLGISLLLVSVNLDCLTGAPLQAYHPRLAHVLVTLEVGNGQRRCELLPISQCLHGGRRKQACRSTALSCIACQSVFASQVHEESKQRIRFAAEGAVWPSPHQFGVDDNFHGRAWLRADPPPLGLLQQEQGLARWKQRGSNRRPHTEHASCVLCINAISCKEASGAALTCSVPSFTNCHPSSCLTNSCLKRCAIQQESALAAQLPCRGGGGAGGGGNWLIPVPAFANCTQVARVRRGHRRRQHSAAPCIAPCTWAVAAPPAPPARLPPPAGAASHPPPPVGSRQ
jgi:hypothetical protein